MSYHKFPYYVLLFSEAVFKLPNILTIPYYSYVYYLKNKARAKQWENERWLSWQSGDSLTFFFCIFLHLVTLNNFCLVICMFFMPPTPLSWFFFLLLCFLDFFSFWIITTLVSKWQFSVLLHKILLWCLAYCSFLKKKKKR